ncbi:hypothetical protein TWF694_001701 [Orbilia ellipsospora]|uniref:Sedlin n=1 Tax=Orbilia ellipsospora TaxID=2528407 RepID=A0AAV9X4H6_9PEZI
MASAPSIPVIAIIGKQNNPIYIYNSRLPLASTSLTTSLDLHLLLHSTLDVFEARLPQKTADQDFGLLFAIDERLAAYGWMTNTSIKFVVIVDQGFNSSSALSTRGGGLGGAIREADLKPVFKSIHSEYIKLISNPFYDHDSKEMVKSKKFAAAIEKIAETGIPGVY